MNSATAMPSPFVFAIDGMTCGHCVKAVTEALAAVPGVSVRSVALGRAEIGAPDAATPAEAAAALDDAG